MNKRDIRKAWGTVRFIEPSQLCNLNMDEKIIVNRVRLNSKNVEIVISGLSHPDKLTVIKRAMRTMQERDRKAKRAGFGAEMTVREALIVFDDPESLPKNTFAHVISYSCDKTSEKCIHSGRNRSMSFRAGIHS